MHRRKTQPEAGLTFEGLAGLIGNAQEAAGFLKALGHDGRLTILCHLCACPRTLSELESLVSARREGQVIYYSILDPRVAEVIRLLSALWAGAPAER